MQGHVHRRVHSLSDGRPTTKRYVVVELGRDAKGRRRQKWHGGFRIRKEAEAAQAEARAPDQHGRLRPAEQADTRRVDRRQLATDDENPVKATTWDNYERMLRLHVVPVLGHRPLHQLTSTMLNILYAVPAKGS